MKLFIELHAAADFFLLGRLCMTGYRVRQITPKFIVSDIKQVD